MDLGRRVDGPAAMPASLSASAASSFVGLVCAHFSTAGRSTVLEMLDPPLAGREPRVVEPLGVTHEVRELARTGARGPVAGRRTRPSPGRCRARAPSSRGGVPCRATRSWSRCRSSRRWRRTSRRRRAGRCRAVAVAQCRQGADDREQCGPDVTERAGGDRPGRCPPVTRVFVDAPTRPRPSTRTPATSAYGESTGFPNARHRHVDHGRVYGDEIS